MPKNKGVTIIGDRLYECADCGERFTEEIGAGNGRQCPECNKFAAKVSDNALACPHCEEIIDLEEWAG